MKYLCTIAFALLLICTTAARPAVAEVAPEPARAEAERVEDLRMLHRFAIQDLHDGKALALYLAGWGGANRQAEVETLLQEAEDVYGLLRAVDNGAAALWIQVNSPKAGEVTADQLALVQRARRTVAEQVSDFYGRCRTLKQNLKKEVLETAGQKTKWQMTERPQPWPNAAREAGRRAGWPRGIYAEERFFNMSRAEIEYWLLKARKAGIEFALVRWAPVTSWGAIEKAPGRFDFAALDELIEMFDRHGMRVCLAMATIQGAPPDWHIEQAGPESQMNSIAMKRGRRRRGKGEPVGRVGINLMHPPTAKAAARFFIAYAAHLKARWPENVDGIYVTAQRELSAIPDISEPMQRFWRTWSGTDTAWRTPEAIRAAEPFDEKAYVQAEMCREAWLVNYVKQVRTALKAGWPELPVQNFTMNDEMHVITHRSAWGNDLYALAQLADNPATHTSSPASYMLTLNLADGRWIWPYGFHSGCGSVAAADFAQVLFFDTARVVSRYWFVRHNYPKSWYRCDDMQMGGFGIGSFVAVPRRSQEMAPVALNTSMIPADVAVLWSHSSIRRDYKFHNAALGFGHMIYRAFFRFDYLPEQLLGQRLKNYKVLILPNTQSMTLDACEAIRQWVRQGGTVIGSGVPGLFDVYGERRNGLPLADVFGADVARMRVPAVIEPDHLQTTRRVGPYAFTTPPPRPYKFKTDMTAALQLQGGKPRAWFAGTARDVAIVEHKFGKGAALLSGFPIGFEYFQSGWSEIWYGTSHHRIPSYNIEQNRYEAWIVEELEKHGISRPVTVPSGRFLRAQRGDDPDWFHVYRNSPQYSEYFIEDEQPARSVSAIVRRREGIDNLYVGLANTEFNFMWERGYFRSTLSGGTVRASVRLPGQGAEAPVVWEARLGVPVPSQVKKDRLEFRTWLPHAQSSMFAVAPRGEVRLFGPGIPKGIGTEALAARSREHSQGEKLRAVEILNPEHIDQFLTELKGKRVSIGCGDRRFRRVALALADWLKRRYGVDAQITMANERQWCRYDMSDGFGWNRPIPEPVVPEILIGNAQDNGLMRRFVRVHSAVHWLPLEVNQDFPGMRRAVVMLSLPIATGPDGKLWRRPVAQQLIIGASFPGEAMDGVDALKKHLKQ